MDIGRLKKSISILEKTYGVPRLKALDDPVDCLIRTILSQNTNDVNRDRAFAGLMERFGDWKNVRRARPAQITSAIRVGGLARIKSKRIKHILTAIEAEHGRIDLEFLRELSPEEAEQKLISYLGVGMKTARCVQLFALGQKAFPVDTHVHRVTKRLGLIPQKTSRDQAHNLLGATVPRNKMYSFHINLIRHGREVCAARQPKCDKCTLRRDCPRAGVS